MPSDMNQISTKCLKLKSRIHLSILLISSPASGLSSLLLFIISFSD